MITGNKDRIELEQRLGHHFARAELLERALTHSSARAGGNLEFDNERLEFLGDRVLGLAIAEQLIKRFPGVPEGVLARRFNRLVRKETCAEIAEAIDLGAHLVLGAGERVSGGRRKQTILANACEAVLGAVFLDAGYGAAHALVERLWADHVAGTTTVRADAKSALQEWAQGRGYSLPRYREYTRQGPDHAPSFTAEVLVGDLQPAIGQGASKRQAEQNAARTLLEREGIWERSEKAAARADRSADNPGKAGERTNV